MNISLKRDEIANVIPPYINYNQLTLSLNHLNANDIIFCQRRVGDDTLIWVLPEKGWLPLSSASEPLKSYLLLQFEECCQQVLLACKNNVSVAQAALMIPSIEDHIFYRQQGTGAIELAVTAYGYKYPPPPDNNPIIDRGQPPIERQEVLICFIYDGQRLPTHPFSINNLPRQTSDNGLFEAGKHNVGTSFSIALDDDTKFTLIVEKGKKLYEFDLTKYFIVEVNVLKEGKPQLGASCVITYNGKKEKIITDKNGHTEIKLPFSRIPCDCSVALDGQKQTKQATMPKTTFYFELPYVKQFCNIDSENGAPIAGVKNVVKVTFPNGITQTITMVSDSNGCFSISATDDAKLEITSTKEPIYESKHTEEPLFKFAKQRIPMNPLMGTLHFRTVDANNGNLLPKCNLLITGSESGSLKPTNSGNGEFDVTFKITEKLTIVASKKGYKDNGDKVKAQTFHYLKDSQERRDIPLNSPFRYEYSGNDGKVKKKYDLFKPNCAFEFYYNVCSGCTTVTLKDDNGNILGCYGYEADGNDSGRMIITCSTKTLHVVVVNGNHHPAHYIITDISLYS